MTEQSIFMLPSRPVYRLRIWAPSSASAAGGGNLRVIIYDIQPSMPLSSTGWHMAPHIHIRHTGGGGGLLDLLEGEGVVIEMF